jgi:hypothetical protein
MKLTGEIILAWIRRNFTEFKVRKGGQEIVMPNPSGDSGAHFNIALVEKTTRTGRKGFWVHDWRPGHQQLDGSFLSFVQKCKGCSFFDAVKDVCGEDTDPRAWLRNARKGQEKAEEIPEEAELSLPVGAKRIDTVEDTLAYAFAVNYLESRAISLEEATQYYIQYNSVSIIFPYIEFGVIAYWQSRAMADKQFDFPPETVGVTKSDFLYGFDFVEPGGVMLVCESIIDSINIGAGAIAFGGGALSQRQVRKIRTLNPSQIILAADNDQPDEKGIRPGVISIMKNHKLLSPYYNKISFAIPPDPYKDWNDVKVAGLDPRQMIESTKKPATLRALISLRNVI